jgi:hypothetical protein
MMKTWIAGTLWAMALLGGSIEAANASATHNQLAGERAVATRITTPEANALQALAVARGEASSALSNPFTEQKVTTPESTGPNATHIPAGGF